MKTNFTKLGRALEGGLYQVYISIYHQGKSNYIPTNIQMLTSEITRLKQYKLTGATANELYDKKRLIDSKIETFFKNYQTHIRIEELKELFKNSYIKSFYEYLTDFLEDKDIEVKDESTEIYRRYNNIIKRYYEDSKQGKPMRELLNTNTIDDFKKYMVKVKYSSSTIKQLLKHFLMFLNYVNRKLDLDELEYSVANIDEKVYRYHLTDDDIVKMFSFDIDNSIDATTGKKTRKNMKENMYWASDMLQLNMHLSLRISELLGIKRSDTELKKYNRDTFYYEIKFYEPKKDRSRIVTVRQDFPMRVIKWYLDKTDREEIFAHGSYSKFKRALKTLAKQAGLTEEVEVTKYTLKKKEVKLVPKYELVTSHAIRRLGIMRNLKRYGIQVAATFSGHSSWRTIKDKYTRELTGEEILEMMDDKIDEADAKNKYIM